VRGTPNPSSVENLENPLPEARFLCQRFGFSLPVILSRRTFGNASTTRSYECEIIFFNS